MGPGIVACHGRTVQDRGDRFRQSIRPAATLFAAPCRLPAGCRRSPERVNEGPAGRYQTTAWGASAPFHRERRLLA